MYGHQGRGSAHDGPPSYLGFGPPKTEKLSFERAHRRSRIGPVLDPIKNNVDLPIPNYELLELLKDFKKEGNELFKEKNYMEAGDHYTCALLLGHKLENVHNEDVDKELLSTLFSNRAACFLKMDIFATGIQDCEFAISLNKFNIKGYYRKATALKALKKYHDASTAANQGRHIAESQGKSFELKEFDDLIREINSHLGEPSSKSPAPQMAAAAARSATHQRDPPSANKQQQGASAYSTQPVKKAVISAKGTVEKKQNYDADESWLAGTNVAVTKKALQNNPQKVSASKKKTSRNAPHSKSRTEYHGRFSTLLDEDVDDDVESDNDNNTGNSSSEDDVSNDSSPRQSKSSPLARPQQWADEVASDMGLCDDFSLPESTYGAPINNNSNAGKTLLADPTKKPLLTTPITNSRSGMQYRSSFQPPGQRTSYPPFGYQRPPFPPPQFPPPNDVLSSQNVSGYRNLFSPIVSDVLLPHPFDNKYDVTFACKDCIVQIGPKPEGFRTKSELVHLCQKDIMVARIKTPYAIWLPVRKRPTPRFQVRGQYRLCQQFTSGVPCKVPQHICSFPHNEIEQHIWNLDSMGQFDLARFWDDWQRRELDKVRRTSKPPPVQQQHQQMRPPPLPRGAYQKPSFPPHPPPFNPSQPPPQRPFYPPNTTHNQAYKPPSEMSYSNIQRTNGTIERVERYIFPFKQTHKFRVVCMNCLQVTPVFGELLIGTDPHQCSEDVLVVQRKGETKWLRIRERRNHRMFFGSYKDCMFYGGPLSCTAGENCHFAHSEEEKMLWNMEKDNDFNIMEFILQNRSQQTKNVFSIDDLFRKHLGCYQFLCHSCFYAHPARISLQDTVNPRVCSSKTQPHPWEENALLININQAGELTAIAKRPFTHKGCFFLLCHRMQFCYRRKNLSCSFAHSMVEKDVWLLERDQEITREELVAQSKQFIAKILAGHQQAPAAGSSGAAGPGNVNAGSTGPSGGVSQSSPTKPAQPAPPEKTKCPYRIIELCGLCWKEGLRNQKSKSRKDRCASSGMGHMWEQNRLCVLVPEYKIIRSLPRRIPTGCRFVICKHVREKKKCDFGLGGNCQYAHSEQEIDIWSWMVRNNLTTLDDLVKASHEAQTTSSSTVAKPIPKGQTVVWAVKPVQPKPVAHPSPFMLSVNALFCHYCSVQCNSQKQWDEHRASEKHLFNLNSDREHQWNHRQPPWGIRGGNYELCRPHLEGSRCPYSDKPDMYNLCKCAHSQSELDEWKERWDWRQMKRDIAREEHVYSFMEELLEDYEEAENGITVLSEDVNGVTVQCMSDLNIFMQEKNSSHTWQFNLQSQSSQPLKRVALLQNADRLHFSLVTGDLAQIAQGDAFRSASKEPGIMAYKVEVRFTGGIFGSFQQWVVFDFGSRPVLVQKLGVELGTHFVQEKVRQLREILTFDRWTGENRCIVKYHIKEDREQDLLRRYKPPTSADLVITQQSINTELNRNNYIHKMHKLLEIEELTRAQIISNYNHRAEIELMRVIQEEGSLINASPGELFARVPLNGQLSEDTDTGKLILTSVQTVLLAQEDTDDYVYEAIMVTRENFDYDGRGRDYIYICLSPQCVRDLELEDGDFLMVEIQFQMNRLSFCRMHFAVDLLENNDVVFPDITKINSLFNENRIFKLSSDTLNEDQLRIVEHIMAERPGYAPPIIVYGPFGTGKTETLAQAAMLVVRENFDARVLICTHSNSAADLYITKHFDAFQKKNPKFSVLRIYTESRRINTVPPIVKKFCLLSPDGSSFVTPIRENILSHHIVITTLSTALNMSRIPQMKGFFTHIFVDEAAQAFECESIMPLALATENTCIVLAGDHMQMSPKVYSAEAKTQKFNKSLLERLYFHYDEFHSSGDDKTSPLNILLSINYRTKMEILRFISAINYSGPERLHSASDLPDVDNIVPLTFYTAHGKEVQDVDSTSYYNMAEVEEIVDRVAEIYNNWPEQWGERRGDSIGVITPYAAQVNRIRLALRKRRLNQVTVERVMNIQGKEFRALFLSTVRTIHLADNPPQQTRQSLESDGDIGDFGFLSDNKLLNTALTRAQSFVAVVGDPLALCAIGDCTNVWRAYLKHCQNMRSIYPPSTTLDTIKSKVINLMNSPKGHNLQMLNALSQEYRDCVLPPPIQQPPTPEVQRSVKTERVKPVSESPNHKPFAARPNTFGSGEWGECRVESDDILKQLAKEAMNVCQQELAKIRESLGASGGSQGAQDEPLRLECVRVKKNEGHAVLEYQPSWAEVTKKRQILSADDHNKQFDSDEDLDEEDEGRSVYMDFSAQQLNDMVTSSPDRYKKCILNIENSSCMYAKVKDPKCDLKEIKISSRLRCGRAFNNDEVVVEILDTDEEDLQALDDSEKVIPEGNVLGILKRAINPQFRMFVCMVEEGNTGLMVPLNRGIPKMFNLETKNHLKKTRRGHVCVYSFTRDKEIAFDHYEPVDTSDTMSKLFIVRYLKWDAKFFSPLGIVVGTLPTGTTIERGLKILDIEYFIPKKFKATTEYEVNRLYNKFSITPSELAHRIDNREKLTFTIDPEGTEDLDDALSIEDLPSGQFRIGIHIADVSFFVQKDGSVDSEACNRGATYYPVGGDPIPMLPTRLSTDLCSLKEGQDRLTLSLFITIDARAHIVDTEIKRCVINSKSQLSYLNIEDILDGDDPDKPVSNDLRVSIQKLHKIAQRWRKIRLGNQGLYLNLDTEAAETPSAHLLVEEMMIMANHQVAILLIQNYPDCTPLRTQLPPNELALDEWREKFADIAKNTVVLTQPFKYRGQVCHCTNSCTCIKSPNESLDGRVSIHADAWHHVMDDIVNADGEFNIDALANLVPKPECCPDTTVALLRLRALQERGNYVCSGDTPEDLQVHYNLNMAFYTHFTSPIRRYIDLMVHRLLVALLGNQQSPYTRQEVASICSQSTDAGHKARKYERATEVLQLSSILQNHPAALHPVIETVDESQIQLRFPTLGGMVPSRSRVPLSILGLSQKPTPEDGVICLKWQSRIYDLKPQPGSDIGGMNSEAILNPDRFVTKIQVRDWRKLLFAVVRNDTEAILMSTVQANENRKDPSHYEEYTEDVSSEVKDIVHSKHFCEYSLSVRPASLCKVLLTTELYKGLMTPRLQLLELSPTLNLCMEHRSDPALCFATSVTTGASKQQYRDGDSYCAAWNRVLAIEGAHCSVTNGDSILIHNVMITWHRAESKVITAVFFLPKSFCAARQINFSGHHNEDEEDDDVDNGKSPESLDYFCIRYHNLTLQEPPKQSKPERFDIDFEQPVSWVGHCLSTSKEVDKKAGIVTVSLRLHQSSVPLPEELLLKGQEYTATVEFISKALPCRRQEAAISNIHRASSLAREIALGRKTPDMGEAHQAIIKDYKHGNVPNLAQPNQAQLSAVNSALSNSFTLIQGPPGTGKTVTGVRIANLFAQINRATAEVNTKGNIKPQVMYCGPSNKSVDVVTAYLKKLGNAAPKIVRVYSESIELQEFPRPLDPVSTRCRSQQKYVMDTGVQDLALHHLIRKPQECTVANLICEFDQRIADCRSSLDIFTSAECEQYRNLIAHAEVEVLKRKEIILVTCNASASPKMKYGTNIKQLIIDECGMCTEPEVMVPIMSAKAANQIVLIGDHKQLRPIVLNDRAGKLGLETSLFERYSHRALILSQQYRMHESIAQFPSQHFYDSRLDCGSDDQRKPSMLKFWPNGRAQPVSFVHVMGKEEVMTVATDEGNEQSRSNMDEVTQAVRAATLLVRRFHVNPCDVVVLSQYRAQCARIQEALNQRGEKQISVSTVIQAQGSEWDYVVISTVRSLPKSQIENQPTHGWRRRHLGFITDQHQINVAITRARKGLIIIGNKYLLSCDPMWSKLLDHYKILRKIVNQSEFMT